MDLISVTDENIKELFKDHPKAFDFISNLNDYLEYRYLAYRFFYNFLEEQSQSKNPIYLDYSQYDNFGDFIVSISRQCRAPKGMVEHSASELMTFLENSNLNYELADNTDSLFLNGGVVVEIPDQQTAQQLSFNAYDFCEDNDKWQEFQENGYIIHYYFYFKDGYIYCMYAIIRESQHINYFIKKRQKVLNKLNLNESIFNNKLAKYRDIKHLYGMYSQLSPSLYSQLFIRPDRSLKPFNLDKNLDILSQYQDDKFVMSHFFFMLFITFLSNQLGMEKLKEIFIDMPIIVQGSLVLFVLGYSAGAFERLSKRTSFFYFLSLFIFFINFYFL